jgi:hypothetical protein
MRGSTLLAQRFDPSRLRLDGEPEPLVDQVALNGGTRRGAFSVSNDGVLAYRLLEDTRLGWFDRGGRPLGSVGPAGRLGNPALSRDGRRVAVDRLDAETGLPDVWLIDLKRGATSRLTNSSGAMPLWSPDGRQLVYRSNGASTSAIYRKTVDDTGPPEALLTGLPVSSTPSSVSPDGRTIVYDGFPGKRQQLWMLRLMGDRKPVPLLQTEFVESHAALSPDGAWIAYVSNESKRNEVYVRAFPTGGRKWQVSSDGGSEPAWRGDGGELFYLATDRTLMAVAVRAGTQLAFDLPQRLFATRMSAQTNPNYTRNQYAVSADGQRFLINETPSGLASVITVVTGWTTSLSH